MVKKHRSESDELLSKRSKVNVESLKDKLAKFLKANVLHAFSDHENVDLNAYTLENGMVDIAQKAWEWRMSFVLNPAHVWKLIIFGVGKFIENNVEVARKDLVNIENNKELSIFAPPTFSIKNATVYEWSKVLQGFIERVQGASSGYMKDFYVPKINAANDTNVKAALSVTSMSIMKQYFNYTLLIPHSIPPVKRGIKSLIVEGTQKDWEILKTQMEDFENNSEAMMMVPKFKNWVQNVIRRLDRIAKEAGKEDSEFFKDGDAFFNGHNASSWLYDFYYDDQVPFKEIKFDSNGHADIDQWLKDLHSNRVVGNICKTDVKLVDDRSDNFWNIEFKSGFVGSHVENEIVKPIMAWWIEAKDVEKMK